MISISDTAVEKAKEILKTEGKEGWGLKIFLEEGGCCGPNYGMDIIEGPEDGDETLEKSGLKLYMDKSASDGLKGMEIDYVSDDEGEGFVIKGDTPPSASSSCGCGCSHD